MVLKANLIFTAAMGFCSVNYQTQFLFSPYSHFSFMSISKVRTYCILLYNTELS